MDTKIEKKNSPIPYLLDFEKQAKRLGISVDTYVTSLKRALSIGDGSRFPDVDPEEDTEDEVDRDLGSRDT